MPILCKRISAPYNLDRSYCTELIFLVKTQTLSGFIDIHLLFASYHGLFSLSKKLPCQSDTGARYFLFPIFHCGFEQFHIKFARYVLIQTVSDTFGVTHLTQYTTIWRKQTFDSEGRAVRVVLNVVCRVAVLIYILCEDLTIFCQLLRFDSWVSKFPWRSDRLPTPVFFPGESPRTKQHTTTTEDVAATHVCTHTD